MFLMSTIVIITYHAELIVERFSSLTFGLEVRFYSVFHCSLAVLLTIWTSRQTNQTFSKIPWKTDLLAYKT